MSMAFMHALALDSSTYLSYLRLSAALQLSTCALTDFNSSSLRYEFVESRSQNSSTHFLDSAINVWSTLSTAS